jgi:hypothetical protein
VTLNRRRFAWLAFRVPDKSIPGRAGEMVVEQVQSNNPTRPLAEDTPHNSALRSTFFEFGLLLQLSDFCNSATTPMVRRVSRIEGKLKVFSDEKAEMLHYVKFVSNL